MRFTLSFLLLLAAGAVRADFSFEYNEHTYKVVTTPATWSEARAAAASQQLNGEAGYLAIIDSDGENQALLDALLTELTRSEQDATRASDGGGAAFVWLGGSDATAEGVWLWDATGEQFWAGDFNGTAINGAYVNWGVEPDNLNNQDVLAMGLESWPVDFGDLGIAGQWNDLAASNRLFYVVEFDTPAATFALALEEPASREIYSGIGNVRGWSVSSEGVEKVEIFIDGNYAFDAPFGGVRGDVAAAFPDVESARQSGFSLIFSYSGLGEGQHTIMARATDGFGNVLERTSTFRVAAYHKPFIFPTDAVNFENAVFAADGDTIRVQNALIDGVVYDLLMEWRTAEQGMEIIEIVPLTQPADDN